MAEINIVRKERSWWPWLVLAAVVVALLWYMGSRNAGAISQTSSRPSDTAVMRGTGMRDTPMRDSSMRATMPRDSVTSTSSPIRGTLPDSTRPPR
jgi:hypothetical protein